MLRLRKALRRLPFLGRWLRWASRRLPLAQVVREVTHEEREGRRQNTRPAYERAQRVYRLLRRSLEGYKHFQEANRFAYRELEMRRLAYLAEPLRNTAHPEPVEGRAGLVVPFGHSQGKLSAHHERRTLLKRLWGQLRANLLSSEAAYHQISSCGDSIAKPLLWLLVSVFALFPALYVLAEITVGGFPYHVGGPWNPGPLWDFSLRTAALLPTEGGDKVMGAALFLQVVERVWSPFLALLFTLAVRRRFRR